ncbi:Tectonin beta-propeller repeat-containing protein [Eumeta japonica]|uniref:Tectonin beta-propeller repeat-containing protein n=1 Tax=Eumeta variegata TaxID=151549 RepID=A0A4C1ZSZ7_EUMVA|nr:Tectonin beta-propeller repeat-containing protein [Eumeta japonica]
MYLGLEFKTLSAVPHFLWAVGGDRQIYLHVHGLEIPIRVKEESYENERWLPLEGFSGRLLPTDRYHFSTYDGTKDRSIDHIRLPSMAWQWEGDWQLELTLDGEPLDHDGWSYAIDFPAQFYPTKNWKSCVRRRKWIRYRKYSAMNSWCAIAPLHKDPTQEPFIDVSIGGNQMPYAPVGSLSVWGSYCTQSCYVQSRSPTGLVWVLLCSGRAMIRKGVTKDCPTGEIWLDVKSPNDTKLSVVSVGYNSVWAVSTDTRVWFRKGIDGTAAGVSETAAVGNSWLEVTGNMVHVSVGPNDQVFAVGEMDKCIYWRSGVAPNDPTGKRWRLIQAPMHLSRTSSLSSFNSTAPQSKHRSLTTLNEKTELKSNINLCNSWEESHSAPIEHTLPIKASAETTTDTKPDNSKNTGNIENIDLTGKSYETTLKNPRAWSPVRSVGSVVGMEAHPESDSSVFDIDSGLYYDDEVSQAAWGTCETMWSFVEAGACNIDPLQVPHWFSDTQNAINTDLISKWRIEILDNLKSRNSYPNIDLSVYGVAIEEKGWTRSCESRLLNVHGTFEDCILTVHWHSSENSGTMSVFNPDGATIKFILNLSEITSIITSSEPGCPRLTISVPNQFKDPIKIQFTSEMEQEEWLNTLIGIVAQINKLSGKPSTDSVWVVTNQGEILNWDPASSSLNCKMNKEGLYTKEIQVFGKDVIAGFTTILHNNFPPGSILKLSGCLHDVIDRFTINLLGPEIKKQRHKVQSEIDNIPFHFNPRFDQLAVVCNTKIFNSWGVEERYELPFIAGQEFSIIILCKQEGFQVIVNKKLLCLFEHRLSPDSIASVEVLGPLKLYEMEYSCTAPIVGPEEMVWRLMGGHLRRVESVGVVVWGIAHDHTAWVYTGGWGGGPLKGLGSNEGIHPMTDTQTYCVYENQRWNPLMGYTSTGLPTDRHMWSDITGKHKRTREHTKLLNRHWHWISEWIIDYNTPGGVDSDGWQYATDFPAPYHSKKLFTDCVRRRRWYRRAQLNTEGPWIRAGNTALVDISLWANNENVTVWAITLGGDALYRGGVTPSTPAGTNWQHVNSPQALTAVSTYNNILWVVGRKRRALLQRRHYNRKSNRWRLIEAPKFSFMFGEKTTSTIGVKVISLTEGIAWAVLYNGAIAIRSAVTRDQPEGQRWEHVTEGDTRFKQVSAGEREVWAVCAAGAVARRRGLATEMPAGAAWQFVLHVGAHHVSATGSRL